MKNFIAKILISILAVLLIAIISNDANSQTYNKTSGYLIEGDTLVSGDSVTVTFEYTRLGNLFSVENQLEVEKINVSATYSLEFKRYKTLDGTNYVARKATATQTTKDAIYTSDTLFFCKKMRHVLINKGADSVRVYNWIEAAKLFK